MWILKRHIILESTIISQLTCCYICIITIYAFNSQHLIAFSIIHEILHITLHSIVRTILHSTLERDICLFEVIVRELNTNTHTIRRDMHSIRLQQFDMTIDTATLIIPAFLHCGISTNAHHVILTKLQIIRDIILL